MAARAAAEPQIMVALASFVGAVGSVEVVVRKGDLFGNEDAIVRKFPQMFGRAEVRSSVAGPVIEQATAAPGEKRGA